MKWCEHYRQEDMGRDEYFKDGTCLTKAVRPDFCCYCGTPRPEKPKTLAEKLGEVSQEGHLRWTQVYEKQAQCALEHFVDVVADCRFLTSSETSKLIEAMRKSVGGGE